jgi:hypothetical protein
MPTSKPIAQEQKPIASWMSGSITVYPRYGALKEIFRVRQKETRLLFHRLEQEQIGVHHDTGEG